MDIIKEDELASKVGGLAMIPEHKQKSMMESYAKFYGVDGDGKIAKISYNKLYKASREQGKNLDPMSQVPLTTRNDPAFKQAHKRFFQNEVSDTASQFNLNAGKFFENSDVLVGGQLKAKGKTTNGY